MTARNKPVVTLVGYRQARPGNTFIHKGSGTKCEGCKYFQVCIYNIESERVYKIVRVRNRTLLCSRYEAEMQVVEVVGAEILAAVPAKQAIRGVVITLQMPQCLVEECENHEVCFPIGLRAGDRCEVLEVFQTLQCYHEPNLKKVALRLVPVF